MNQLFRSVLLLGAISLLPVSVYANASGIVTHQEIVEMTCNKQPKGIKRNACFKVEYYQLEYYYDEIFDAIESDPKAVAAFTKAIRQKDYVNILKYYKRGYNVYKISGDTYDLPNPN